MAANKTKPAGLKSDKEWRDAIRLAVHEVRDHPGEKSKVKVLRLAAGKLAAGRSHLRARMTLHLSPGALCLLLGLAISMGGLLGYMVGG